MSWQVLAFAFAPPMAALAAPAAPPILPSAPPPPPFRQRAAPLQPITRLITDADYPIAAIANSEQGEVGVVVSINPQGRVDNCQIVKSSGSALLDRVSCTAITRRARYSPALDSRGAPTDDRAFHRIRWEMEALPFQPSTLVTSFASRQVPAVAECSSSDCVDGELTFADVLNLTGEKAAPNTEYWVERRIVPGGRREEKAVGYPRGRPLFASSVSVTIDPRGKVSRCRADTADAMGTRLCMEVSGWLFALAADDGERSATIGLSISSRSAPSGR